MTALNTLLDSLRGRKEHRAISYADLTIRVADGEETSPDIAEATLAAANKSTSDLEKDVSAILRRRDLRVKAADYSVAEVGLLDVRRQVEAAKAKLQVAQDEFGETAGRLQAIEAQLMQRMSEARQASQELRRTAPAEILECQALVGRQRTELHNERREVAKKLEMVVANRESTLEHSHRHPSIDYSKEFQGFDFREKALKAELEQIDAREKDLAKQSEQLQRDALEA